jgi:hypothetical protein
MGWSPQLLAAGLMVGLASIIVQIRRARKAFQKAFGALITLRHRLDLLLEQELAQVHN